MMKKISGDNKKLAAATAAAALAFGAGMTANASGSGAKFTQGECILYHELKLEVFR